MKIYVELAFWASTVAAVIGAAVGALTGFPGDIVPQAYLVGAAVVQAVMSSLAAAFISRTRPAVE